eukprot:scaffold154190_cov22-Tisochrysis_lutea.AAC.1
MQPCFLSPGLSKFEALHLRDKTRPAKQTQVLADFKVVSETADSMPGTAVGSVAHETARDMSSVYR